MNLFVSSSADNPVNLVSKSLHFKPDSKPLNTISTRLPYNPRPITVECMHLVMHSHFLSRDKDVGHTTQSAIAENPMTHANFMALCFIDPELLPIEICIVGTGIFYFFAPVTLTFIYDHDPYTFEIYRMCKYQLPTSRLLKDILRQTDTSEIMHHTNGGQQSTHSIC